MNIQKLTLAQAEYKYNNSEPEIKDYERELEIKENKAIEKLLEGEM